MGPTWRNTETIQLNKYWMWSRLKLCCNWNVSSWCVFIRRRLTVHIRSRCGKALRMWSCSSKPPYLSRVPAALPLFNLDDTSDCLYPLAPWRSPHLMSHWRITVSEFELFRLLDPTPEYWHSGFIPSLAMTRHGMDTCFPISLYVVLLINNKAKYWAIFTFSQLQLIQINVILSHTVYKWQDHN